MNNKRARKKQILLHSSRRSGKERSRKAFPANIKEVSNLIDYRLENFSTDNLEKLLALIDKISIDTGYIYKQIRQPQSKNVRFQCSHSKFICKKGYGKINTIPCNSKSSSVTLLIKKLNLQRNFNNDENIEVCKAKCEAKIRFDYSLKLNKYEYVRGDFQTAHSHSGIPVSIDY